MMIIVRIEKDTKKYFIVGYTELFSMLALLFIVRSILIKLFLLCCLFLWRGWYYTFTHEAWWWYICSSEFRRYRKYNKIQKSYKTGVVMKYLLHFFTLYVEFHLKYYLCISLKWKIFYKKVWKSHVFNFVHIFVQVCDIWLTEVHTKQHIMHMLKFSIVVVVSDEQKFDKYGVNDT